MVQINDFLALDIINNLPLTFHSAKDLRGRVESLPSSPRWKSHVIPTSHPTKSPAVLYWWDPLECIASLFNHPLSHRLHSSQGEHAWEMQSALPHGTTLLGTILSSDKTCITALSGDRVAHSILISLANIHMDIHLKSSSNAFLLAALLPVSKFIHTNK
ncbi:hypothetical protein C8R48DRAFT_774571 [Suillus tomentosus]|nr:hypothetical protein C8R48DRAFT_774571 [Suillus tomentosus]